MTDVMLMNVDAVQLNMQRLVLSTISRKELTLGQQEALDSIQEMLDQWAKSCTGEMDCDECGGVEGQHFLNCSAWEVFAEMVKGTTFTGTGE